MEKIKKSPGYIFILYGLLVYSLWLFYDGFSSLYLDVYTDLFVGGKKNIEFDSLAVRNDIVLGGLFFFSVRFMISRLEKKGTITPDDAKRFFVLFITILIFALSTVLNLVFVVHEAKFDRNIDGFLQISQVINLTIKSFLLLYCFNEIRREKRLRFLTSLSVLFFLFCVGSLVLEEIRAPRWQDRQDEKQLERLSTIGRALEHIYIQQEDVPEKLTFIRADIDEDLVTHQPYEYKKLSPSTYEICAYFLTDYEDYRERIRKIKELVVGQGHHKGRKCYVLDASRHMIIYVPVVPHVFSSKGDQDEAQLRRLSIIGRAIEYIYYDKKAIPEKLTSVLYHRPDVIEDFVTHQPYEYKKLSPSTYEICAYFLTDYEDYREDHSKIKELVDGQVHRQGRKCYVLDASQRMILYPPFPPFVRNSKDHAFSGGEYDDYFRIDDEYF